MSSSKPAKSANKRRLRRPRIRRVGEKHEGRGGRSALWIVYILGGLLIAVGIAMLVVRYVGGNPITASKITINQAVRPLTVPFGQTPDGYWYKGVAEAPVTVIEFGDYQCPSCAAAFSQIEGGIDKDYVNTGKIKFAFQDFPLPIHPNAKPTAEAARCAGDQGKYWSMHDVLFSRQSEWQGDGNVAARLKSYAEELDLDTARFGRCLDTGKYTLAIQDAIADGTQQGIDVTPTYLVDGKQVDANGLRAAIDAALTAKGR